MPNKPAGILKGKIAGIPTPVVIGVVGVGGYLIWRHYSSSSSTSSSSPYVGTPSSDGSYGSSSGDGSSGGGSLWPVDIPPSSVGGGGGLGGGGTGGGGLWPVDIPPSSVGGGSPITKVFNNIHNRRRVFKRVIIFRGPEAGGNVRRIFSRPTGRNITYHRPPIHRAGAHASGTTGTRAHGRR